MPRGSHRRTGLTLAPSYDLGVLIVQAGNGRHTLTKSYIQKEKMRFTFSSGPKVHLCGGSLTPAPSARSTAPGSRHIGAPVAGSLRL